MSTCRRTFEPATTQAQRDRTHTCELAAGHRGSHVCPRCGARWVSEPGQRRNTVVTFSTGGEEVAGRG